MIQANINTPCVLLDFPTLGRFVEEIRSHRYDVVGISSIISNLLKVKKMCELIRQHQPHVTIVIGGHIANVPDLNQRIDADHIVKGDGVSWFRGFLGESLGPLRHPMVYSGLGARSCGISLGNRPGDVAAALFPSVGCPKGCNFCSTSAMFGGKGHFIDFYKTGDELFHVMCQLGRELEVQSFFVMDENFLLHRTRALRLLELMEKHGKSWSLYVFTSADMLRSYTIDQLIRLGISWVWMGIEGEHSQYTKLQGINTFALVKELQSHGIRVLGSTIIGLEGHKPENMDEVIDYAVRHATDFHQFMLYTPVPGTPLHAELSAKGLMKAEGEYELGDIHGQSILNYHHPALNDRQTAEYIIRAFDEDFEANGPSVVRIVRTTLNGWLRHKNHSDPCVRQRFGREARGLATRSAALVAAAKLYYRDQPVKRAAMEHLLARIRMEFGLKSRIFSALGGRWLLRKIRNEEQRLAEGIKYEPPTIYERNEAVADRPEVPLCRFVEPLSADFIDTV